MLLFLLFSLSLLLCLLSRSTSRSCSRVPSPPIFWTAVVSCRQLSIPKSLEACPSPLPPPRQLWWRQQVSNRVWLAGCCERILDHSLCAGMLAAGKLYWCGPCGVGRWPVGVCPGVAGCNSKCADCTDLAFTSCLACYPGNSLFTSPPSACLCTTIRSTQGLHKSSCLSTHH